MLSGIIFTALIACMGYIISYIPGFHQIGPLASAIFISILYRHFFGYPKPLQEGIQFSAQKFLRLAIILFGLQLNIQLIFSQGIQLLFIDIGVIIFAIIFTTFIGKKLKADHSMLLLLGVGTGVCGAAAIAAVSPVLQSKKEDTAISIGIIAFVGTIFALAYTVLMPFISLTSIQYGIWSGISLHEIAHVGLATAPAGLDALSFGFLGKLGRVFLLIPLIIFFLYKNKKAASAPQTMKIQFPWFLLGFIVMSLLGSYVLPNSDLMHYIKPITTFLLTMAMVGLGLNIDLRTLKNTAIRPLVAMVCTSILLSIITFGISCYL